MDLYRLIKRREALRLQITRYTSVAENILKSEQRDLKEIDLDRCRNLLKDLHNSTKDLDDQISKQLDDEDLETEFQIAFDYEDRIDCTVFDLDYTIKRINIEEETKRRTCFQSNNYSYRRKIDNHMIRTCIFCGECHFSLQCPVYSDRNIKTLKKLELEEKTDNSLENSSEDLGKNQSEVTSDVSIQLADSAVASSDDITLELASVDDIEVEDACIFEDKSAICISEYTRAPADISFFHVHINRNLIEEYFSWSEGFFGIKESNVLDPQVIKTEAITDLKMVGMEINLISMEEIIEAEDLTGLKLMMTLEFRTEYYDYDAGIYRAWFAKTFRRKDTELVNEQLSRRNWKD